MEQTARKSFEDFEFTPYLRKMVILASGGPCLDGYVTVIIGLALVQLASVLQLNAFWSGLIGASCLLGIFIGGAVFGYVTDLVGRQVMFTVDLAAIVILSIIQMFIHTPLELFVLRFLIGIAIGADYPIATALVTEFSPRRYRAMTMGLVVAAWYIGALLAGLIGYLLVDMPDGWKWMLGSAAIPALVLVLGRWGTPESPRWLLNKGRTEEAREAIRKVYGPGAELQMVDTTEKTRFSKVFSAGYLRRTIYVGVMYTCQIVPMYAIYTFGPKILSAFGMGEGKMAILGDVIISFFFLLGCVPALYLLNSIGRRPLVIWSFVVMTLSLLILCIFPGASISIVIIAFAIYALFSGAPSILEWLYPNELFPTDIRATAVGIGVAFSRVGSFLGTFLLPYGLKYLGIGPTMLVGVAVSVIGLVASIFLAPETKGLTLMESSTLD